MRFTGPSTAAVLFLLLIPASGWSEFAAFPGREINFGRRELIGRFMPARELDIWARNHNMKLLPDSPARDIQDYEAEVIAPEGGSFDLSAPGRGRVFLYLDLVAFAALSERDLPRVQWLDVFINGKPVKTIFCGGNAPLASPVIITVDRELVPLRKMHVTLRPSPGDGFFSIWDAFVSEMKEGPRPEEEAAEDM